MILARHRFVAVVIALFVFTAVFSGCGGGIAAALQIIGLKAILPDKWEPDKSIVKLVADVIAGDSLMGVIAHVTRSDSSEIIEVVMTPTTEGKYEGTFEVPSLDDQSVTYTAVVTATDQSGKVAVSEPVTIETPPAADVTTEAE